MSAPLIEVENLRKRYGGIDGAPVVDILRGVSLRIAAGEFVAIVGASGSGKSTLMNVLGCLDRPSEGRYRFAGRDVATLTADELAWLRREAFGFVFQGYHLVPTDSALENVEMPAIYAGTGEAERHARARQLLGRLGLAQRVSHRPNQLSGGQQQRVSIARALMNGGRVVLADEPTGALDSASGAEVMQLLSDLADAGHTVILITHDATLAACARRVIEIRDGTIVRDTADPSAPAANADAAPFHWPARPARSGPRRWPFDRAAARAAWRVMGLNRFRTALTLLGIVIGVASVIVMFAIGLGAKDRVMTQIGAFGSNLLYMAAIGESSRMPGRSLTLADLDAIAALPDIAHVLPNITGNRVVRAGSHDMQTYVRGTGPALPSVQNWQLAQGSFFDAEDERQVATVAVLGSKVARELLPDTADPVGRTLLIGRTPFLVIGVMSAKGALTGEKDDDNVVLVPFSTASVRVFGQREPTYAVIAVRDVARVAITETAVAALIEKRHRMRDFQIFNSAASLAAQAKTQDAMTVMLSLIAVVSLVVGGIGVMNVMLMTVRERTREIGIRIATGARHGDIVRQFLTEAMLVSITGGVLGVLIGLAIGLGLLAAGVPAVFSLRAILAAFGCSLATGLVFGYMPARQAARLDPVVALHGA
ncbi:MacB family efflux pump subunit [Chitinasiproducens palmae]|uniref:Pyoverdine export ATP-binding/permease protein PvdT n=1 Tax=Chitinasiproducens palmae TaxID=1770053 RepID=A0A1H2PV74_9BURK|nr:MacB family efflux pump subunit [Chitinasiproducens palmae]SDV51146.1 macrolide transport system ATP-binding/permease protein [Chitinasiproducens palmae]